MFGLKIIKKETIENYEKEIKDLKGKFLQSQELLNAMTDDYNSLLSRFAETTSELNSLREQAIQSEQEKPAEKKTRRKPAKKETEKEETPEEKPKTPKKKRVYKKRTEKKSE